ncbi:MAG: phosphodiester glycosidase family protein [Armatimonadetes bacterium]|nr:MAG: phosphodiester glycosidase family protein [Armatimonadota bacterium]
MLPCSCWFRAFIALAVCGAAGAAAGNVAYEKRKVGDHWFHVVVVNLNSDNVRVSVQVNRSRGRAEPFSSMVSRTAPSFAVSGTFFDIATARPIGAIVSEGREIWPGNHGSALTIDFFNRARVVDPPHGVRLDPGLYRLVVRGGVRILNAGQFSAYPTGQRFRDPRVWSAAKRIGVGVTENNKLVFVGTNDSVYMRDVASALKLYGVRSAIALDGGSSAGMYWRGSYLVHPARRLTNILTVHEGPGIAWVMAPPPDW